MGITRIKICYADGSAEVRFLPDGTYLIGRGTGAIALDDPNVSTRHAELEISGERVIVRDLGSRNGSRDPAGQRLTGPYTMKTGELIGIGRCSISLASVAPVAETEVMKTVYTPPKFALANKPVEQPKPPADQPVRARGQIFISHVAEDSVVALRLALLLEQAGYSSWVYELDSIAGVSHLQTTLRAIEQAQAFVLLISQKCVESHEVTTEITRAHDLRKVLIPLLHRISHEELMQRRAEWGQRFAGKVSIDIWDLEASVERLSSSLEHFGVVVAPGSEPQAQRLRALEKEIKRLEAARPPPDFPTELRRLPPAFLQFLIKCVRVFRRLADTLRA